MSLTGDPEGQPQKYGIAITDILTGIYATTGILAAVYQRNSTGLGQHIDMSLLDVAVAVTSNQAMNYLTTGVSPRRMGNAHINLAPYQVFDCANGHIIIATGNDGQYQRLCKLLGLSDMALAPEFLKNADRLKNRDEMDRRLTEATKKWSKADLLAACEAEGVPAGPINTMGEVMDDAQVKARGMRIEPEGVPGLRSPFTFSDADLDLSKASPKRGEHNGDF